MLFKSDEEFLEIKIILRRHADKDDYCDGNWLYAEINILVEGFKANYYTNLRAEELHKFYQDLALLCDYAIKEIEFSTMEEGIYLKFKAQSNGIFHCEGIAIDSPNKLKFELHIENQTLKQASFQLQNIIKQYPILGENK